MIYASAKVWPTTSCDPMGALFYAYPGWSGFAKKREVIENFPTVCQ